MIDVRFIQLRDGRILPQQRIDAGGRYRWVACECLPIESLSESEAQEARQQIDIESFGSGPPCFLLQAQE